MHELLQLRLMDGRRRQYRSGDITAETVLAQGRCYAPKCAEPLFKVIEDVRVNNYEIAHIYALNPGGPRWDETKNDPIWLNSPENWLLLCHGHHQLIDRVAPEKYKPEHLMKWKADRQVPGLATLLPAGLTEERLEAVLAEALDRQQTRIEDALSRLGQIDPEAARLLREVVEAANDLSNALAGDTVEMLSNSSIDLRGLGEYSETLLHAAQGLQHLPDTAETLAHAAESLQRLGDDAALLNEAAEKLRDARGQW